MALRVATSLRPRIPNSSGGVSTAKERLCSSKSVAFISRRSAVSRGSASVMIFLAALDCSGDKSGGKGRTNSDAVGALPGMDSSSANTAEAPRRHSTIKKTTGGAQTAGESTRIITSLLCKNTGRPFERHARNKILQKSGHNTQYALLTCLECFSIEGQFEIGDCLPPIPRQGNDPPPTGRAGKCGLWGAPHIWAGSF